uniref:Uncharacterized protein n=1 Tax=Quercus lobata TaxID=97700 RepID=A0A7N2LFE7_QUELO
MPDAKTAFDSDTLPTSTTHNEPATPCAQPFDVKSQILNERESDVKVLNPEQKKSHRLLMKELENLSRKKRGIKTS